MKFTSGERSAREILSALALLVGVVGVATFAAPRQAEAQFSIGAVQCGDQCHQPEYEVWEASPHQASFLKFDYPDDELAERIDTILEAAGDEYMTESPTCSTCHFTMVQEEAGDTPWVDSGPSCESCHGAGSEHQEVHSEKERDLEERMAEAEQLGMVRPHMKYAIAENCNGCHAMAREEIDGETITALLDAGHPINPEFELVRYSQGSVKHRFYPPDTSVNADMTESELAGLFIQGQAAQLVAAAASLEKSSHGDYRAAMQQRIDVARDALARVAGAGDFIANPTRQSALELIGRLEGQDVFGMIGDLLPDPDRYIRTAD